MEREKAFSIKNLAVLGISDVRRMNKKIIKLKSQNMFSLYRLYEGAKWGGVHGV